MLSDRLRTAMAASNMSQAELARLCRVAAPSVNGWLGGKSKFLRGENLLAAARALNVSQDWLATGVGAMHDQTARAPTASTDDSEFFDLDAHPDLERVRKVNLRLEAGVNGFSIESEEGEGEPVFFRKKWLSSRGYKSVNLIAIKVMGNSMEPNLYPDDLVVINTADTEPKDGKVFAINYEGEAVVKRMVRDGGSWWLSSDNPDQRRFGRKECSGSTCLVIGRVIHKQSEQI